MGVLPLSLGVVTGSLSRKAGGLFNSVRRSAISIHEFGAHVSVYGLEDKDSATDLADWKPLLPHALSTWFSPVFPFAHELEDRLVQANHDILHLHGLWLLQSRAVNRWRRKTGRPTMISPRGMLDPWALANSGWKKRLVGAWFEDRNLSETDCLHALNLSEAASMRAYGLLNPIAVIPNGVDLPEISPRPSRTDIRTLLFLGRIHPKKGLKELISAWSEACTRTPRLANRWRLRIAGWDDGNHIAELQRQIDDFGVTQSVHVAGPAFGAEKDQLFRNADAFILPSFSEGLPMSVLEAWAYRLPVLMTAECNLPEGFSYGAAVEISTQPQKMAESLTQTLLEKDVLALGAAGRELVEETFSWPKIAQTHLSVYDWMLHGGRQPPCVQLVNR